MGVLDLQTGSTFDYFPPSSEVLSPAVSPPGAARHIRRWLNYLCSELQQLQVVITEGTRSEKGGQSESDRWCEGEGERERGEEGGKEGGGGAVESKKRIEQWRESMFPTRSIQLSIILLQPVDALQMKTGVKEGGRDRERERESERGETRGALEPTCSAECDGEPGCCNANVLSCLCGGF